jgi:hypothetical protein
LRIQEDLVIIPSIFFEIVIAQGLLYRRPLRFFVRHLALFPRRAHTLTTDLTSGTASLRIFSMPFFRVI